MRILIPPHAAKNGLSSVRSERPGKTIDAIVDAYQLPSSPQPAAVFTDAFFPLLPIECRRRSTGGNSVRAMMAACDSRKTRAGDLPTSCHRPDIELASKSCR